jgi:hypothetical protein
MTAKQIYEIIEKGLNNTTELSISVKHGLGTTIDDTHFQAYILGSDTYQYSFVWGYLPGQNLYYKFMLNNISAIKLTSKKYKVRKDACYQYSIEEEHYGCLDGFDNIYMQAAQHKPD